jgi:hypothetical protein
MSWATITGAESEFGDRGDRENEKTEEALLHELRTTYNQALTLMVGSAVPGDAEWSKGLSLLETITQSESLRTVAEPTRSKVMEIAFLANKNRIEAYAKCPQQDQSSVYVLALETVQLMIDLGKSDILLVLQTARYAKAAGDMWTYRLLMQQHMDQLPYLYKDIVLRQYHESLQQDDHSAGPASSWLNRMPSEIGDTVDCSNWVLQDDACEHFVAHLFEKTASGKDSTTEDLLVGFDVKWVTPRSQDEMDVCDAVEGVPNQSAGTKAADISVQAPERTVLSSAQHSAGSTSPTTTPVPTQQEEQPAPVLQLQAPRVAATAAEVIEQAPSGQASTADNNSGRRSGRSSKKTAAALALQSEVRTRTAAAGAATTEEEALAQPAVSVGYAPAAVAATGNEFDAHTTAVMVSLARNLRVLRGEALTCTACCI